MSNATEKQFADSANENTIQFKCKFCQESKPLKDLVIMRQYFPQIAVCKTCSLGSPAPEPDVSPESPADPVSEDPDIL